MSDIWEELVTTIQEIMDIQVVFNLPTKQFYVLLGMEKWLHLINQPDTWRGTQGQRRRLSDILGR